MKLTPDIGLVQLVFAAALTLAILIVGSSADVSPWVTSLMSGAVGGLLVVGVEGVVTFWRRPQLRLSYSGSDDCLAESPIVDPATRRVVAWGLFARLKVENTGWQMARSCRAFLVRADEYSGEELKPSIYSDSLALWWSCRPRDEGADPIDIPRGVAQYVDVLCTKARLPLPRRGSKALYEWEIRIPGEVPLRYLDHFAGFPRKYRFVILVAGDGVDPVMINLDVSLGEAWTELAVAASPQQA